MKQSDNKTKSNRKLPPFSLRSEVKRNEAKYFSLWYEKVFFAFLHLKRNENKMKQKQNEKKRKLQSEKNSGTFCKETKKNIKVVLLTFQTYTWWSEKMRKTYISFPFEAKQSEKTFISFLFEAKRRNRKRKEKFLEGKQSKNVLY
jgi:hypothetical protein